VGFSAGGVSAVGFIVKIGAINQNVDPSVALCRSQRIAVSGCIIFLLLACVAWCLDAYVGHAIATQTPTSSAYSLSGTISEQRRFCYNPHRRPALLHPSALVQRVLTRMRPIFTVITDRSALAFELKPNRSVQS
jgi:hypothetical protein